MIPGVVRGDMQRARYRLPLSPGVVLDHRVHQSDQMLDTRLQNSKRTTIDLQSLLPRLDPARKRVQNEVVGGTTAGAQYWNTAGGCFQHRDIECLSAIGRAICVG